MAGLFGGPEAPQYVGPGGTALATQPHAKGLFGVFPGTPEYATPAKSDGGAPSPTQGPGEPSATPPGVEVSVRVPGLISLQGSLWVPPWLKESAPALLPLLLHILQQRIEAELCRTPAPSAPTPGDGGRPCEPPPEPEEPPRGDSESLYSRVWPGREG
jgi:hypothetical protein